MPAIRDSAAPGLTPVQKLVVATLAVFGIAAELLVAPFVVARGASVRGVSPGGPGNLGFVLNSLAFICVGVAVARRQPANRSWIALLAVGLAGSLFGATSEYAIWADTVVPGRLPAAALATWLASWCFTLIPVAVFMVLLVFPTGRLFSRRWRFAAWLIVAGGALRMAVDSVSPAFPQNVGPVPRIKNPLALPGADEPFLLVVGTVATTLIGLGLVAAIASLVVRFRSATYKERQQIKWFLLAAPLPPLGFVTYPILINPATPRSLFLPLLAIQAASVLGMPVAVGIAILKYRLYDVDIAINRTLVYGALAVIIAGGYVAVVAGIGALLGTRGSPNLLTSVVATAIVGLAVHPARTRLQRLGNRIVYGKRATPYEVLAAFNDSVRGTFATDDVVLRMAQLLAEATGALEARVWIALGDTLRPAARFPAGADDASVEQNVPGEQAAAIPGVDRSLAIRHEDELLGAISVRKRRGETLTATEEALMNELATQAALVLRNVALTANLRETVDELRASRKRLVAAQDDERRRLERNLHDGAQQNLVALKLKLSLVEAMLGRDLDKAKGMVAEAKADADETLSTMRDLARGIYPPLLAEQGLASALEAQVRKATVPVTLEVVGSLPRFARDVESTVYFACLEALQNVQKYAQATRAEVVIRQVEGRLEFEVRDDGAGFDPQAARRGAGLQNLVDRLDALGGTISIKSAPGAGTSLRGSIPVNVSAGGQVTA